jgi:large subunit ribosomal protein L32
MGVPKRKHSKQRKRMRRAGWGLEAPNLVNCPQCQARMLPHRVCQECGFYKAKKVVNKGK